MDSNQGAYQAMARQLKPLKHKYSGTLFFFPALLPLAELVPWVLALLGAVAGVAGFSFPVFWRRHRRVILSAMLVLAGGCAWFAYDRMPDIAVVDTGTAAIDHLVYPQPVRGTAQPVPTALTAGAFRVLWSQPLGQQVLSSPVLDDDVIIFGSLGGSVEALWRANGLPVWSLPMMGPVTALTKGPDHVVFAGEGLHEDASAILTALDARDGTVLWQRSFLGHLESEGTVDADRHVLWISAGPGGLWAVDTRDGAVIWHAPLGHIDSAPLHHGGHVYIAADKAEQDDVHDTVFSALDDRKGKTLWQIPLPGQPWGSPLWHAGSGRIIMTTGTGQIGVRRENDSGWAQAITPDGEVVWQVNLPDMPLQPPVYYAPDDLYIHTTKTGGIVALHAQDGSVAWHVATGHEYQSSAILVTHTPRPLLVAVDWDGEIALRDPATGALVATARAGHHATASPVVAADVLYVPGARTMEAFAGLMAAGIRHD